MKAKIKDAVVAAVSGTSHESKGGYQMYGLKRALGNLALYYLWILIS